MIKPLQEKLNMGINVIVTNNILFSHVEPYQKEMINIGFKCECVHKSMGKVKVFLEESKWIIKKII